MLSLALSPLSLSGLAPRSAVSSSRVAAPQMVQSKSMPMMEAPEVRALPAALPCTRTTRGSRRVALLLSRFAPAPAARLPAAPPGHGGQCRL
jgi:hypothetical protein